MIILWDQRYYYAMIGYPTNCQYCYYQCCYDYGQGANTCNCFCEECTPYQLSADCNCNFYPNEQARAYNKNVFDCHCFENSSQEDKENIIEIGEKSSKDTNQDYNDLSTIVLKKIAPKFVQDIDQ